MSVEDIIEVELENARFFADKGALILVVMKLRLAEQYASEAKLDIKEKVEKIKQLAYTNGLCNVIQSAMNIAHEGEIFEMEARLLHAEQIAEYLNVSVADFCKHVRKIGYESGINIFLEHAKLHAKDGEIDEMQEDCITAQTCAANSDRQLPELDEVLKMGYLNGMKKMIFEASLYIYEKKDDKALEFIKKAEEYAKKAGCDAQLRDCLLMKLN